MNEPLVIDADFFVTKQHRLFAEFCDACRNYRYIGLCYGAPGVGKTVSAEYYSRWDRLGPRSPTLVLRPSNLPPDELIACRTILYTPEIMTNPRRIDLDLYHLRTHLSYAVGNALNTEQKTDKLPRRQYPDVTELILVDEADRLKMQGLEQMRAIYDRGNIGLIFIGMPGIEKRLARYAQLYSRVGFVHQFGVLNQTDLQAVLMHKWRALRSEFDPDDPVSVEAMKVITNSTAGNFRLIERLFTQIDRVLQINQLTIITKEVVETARELLVMGTN